jgi:hypothetical protein
MAKQHSFANKEAAEGERGNWKQTLPKVPSAYVPSGKLPDDAINRMTVGVLLGVAAGAGGGIVAGSAGIAVSIAAISIYKAFTEGTSRVPIFGTLAVAGVVIASFVFMYVAIGLAASRTVMWAGKRAKCRNTTASMAMSIVSSLGGLVPFQLVMSYSPIIIGDSFATEPLANIFGTGEAGIVCLAIGGIAAAITAGASARHSVQEAKFCEICELYMETAPPRLLSFATVTEAAKCLSASDITAAAAALIPVPKEAEEASLKLFHCPQCRSAFAEIKVTFAAKWPKKGKPNQFANMAETWLAISRVLPARDFDVLSKAPEPKLAAPA